nr:hypothetical protein [Oceanococcus sp. HetDA_MAG_MS8]
MCDIPIEVLDDEKIIRTIKTPHHINKKLKLRPAAFRPPPERDDLSVMRLDHMGADGCKNKSKEIAGESYLGLAAINAGEIRKTGASIEDSRQGQFCGHADISQGMSAPKKGETAPPVLAERYKALSDAARLYIDEEPQADHWTGGVIS